MTARIARFRQIDIARAAKGAMQAGLKPSRVEIDAAGKIVIICGDGAPETAKDPAAWEKRLRSATGWAK